MSDQNDGRPRDEHGQIIENPQPGQIGLIRGVPHICLVAGGWIGPWAQEEDYEVFDPRAKSAA